MRSLKKFVRLWNVKVPSYIKWIGIFILFISLFLASFYVSMPWKNLILRLYYLPIFMGSLLGGLKGGLFCAFIASLFSCPFIKEIFQNNAVCLQEILLFFIFGILTGFLVDKERAEREELKQTKHLAILGKAAAIIAHEFKTPLVVIGGFAKLLYKKLPSNDPNRKKLEIILKETKWMEDMAHGILDFSKPVELNLKRVDFSEFIQEVIKLAQIGHKNPIRLNFKSNVPQIVIDPDKFKQVLINLLNNAVQAAPDKPVEVNVFTQNQHLKIEIRDQGPGIPKEYHKKIFEPFFTTKTRGTGLGLAIVKRIVEAHQGKISFKSTLGKGTTFIITIPIKSTSNKPHS